MESESTWTFMKEPIVYIIPIKFSLFWSGTFFILTLFWRLKRFHTIWPRREGANLLLHYFIILFWFRNSINHPVASSRSRLSYQIRNLRISPNFFPSWSVDWSKVPTPPKRIHLLPRNYSCHALHLKWRKIEPNSDTDE